MISSAFRGAGEDLSVGKIKETAEGFRNGFAFLFLRFDAGQERNFDEHAGD